MEITIKFDCSSLDDKIKYEEMMNASNMRRVLKEMHEYLSYKIENDKALNEEKLEMLYIIYNQFYDLRETHLPRFDIHG